MRASTFMLTFLFAAGIAAQEGSSQICPKLPGQPLPLPQQLSSSTCANGDFESGLDASEWFGQHGAVTHSGDPVFLATGLSGGPLASCDAHQTAVAAGVDPIAGISTVAPGGSTRSVRLGNSVWAARTESLGKTFIVEQNQRIISFSYAVVFQNPNHPEHQRPSFEVLVVDAAGKPVPGAVVNLGNGKNKVIAGNDPAFFQSIPDSITLYRDWTCATVTLPEGQVGKAVTVLFINEDCARGGHYGYAYIDNFCGGGDCVPLKPGCADECGVGQICFRYTLGSPNDPVPHVELQILQDGALKASLTEPTVTNETICFAIDPARLPPLEPGFDYTAITSFGRVGSQAEGVTPGVNNDYFPSCGTPGCCQAVNLIVNGDFEAGNTGFETGYDLARAPYGAGAVRPGQYAILTPAEAASVASTWTVKNHSTCREGGEGNVLVVNGETCRTRRRKVWSQNVDVIPGTTYRFCANVRNLPQPAFDVKPEIELRFTSPLPTVTKVVTTNKDDACDWMLVDTELTIPAGITTITCEIWLKDSGDGDGNDLAVDDISLQKLAPPCDPDLALFDVVTSDIENGTYTIAATPINGQPFPFTWEVCEVDGDGNCIDGTRSLGTTAPAGPFDARKKYRITYAVDDPCATVVTRTWEK